MRKLMRDKMRHQIRSNRISAGWEKYQIEKVGKYRRDRNVAIGSKGLKGHQARMYNTA